MQGFKAEVQYDKNRDSLSAVPPAYTPTICVQGLDRYAYTNNNPLRYTDPTGHFSKDEIIDFFGVDNWNQVLVIFDNGDLKGRCGWLLILEAANIGDKITILSGDQNTTGRFELDSSGDLIIAFPEGAYYINQEKVALIGDTFELSQEIDLSDVLCSPFDCTLEYNNFTTDAVIPVPPYMNNVSNNPHHKTIPELILEGLEDYSPEIPEENLPSGNYSGAGGGGGSPIDIMLID